MTNADIIIQKATLAADPTGIRWWRAMDEIKERTGNSSSMNKIEAPTRATRNPLAYFGRRLFLYLPTEKGG